MAQVQGGHDTVQDAIRFERQKDAADARQARIEAAKSNADRSSADRSSENARKNSSNTRTTKKKAGSASRSTDKQ
jgi:hypothetical protein